MGHISLPSLDDIVQEKDPRKQSEMLLNTVGILIKNLSELNGYLTSKNIRPKSIETESLKAGAVTADKVDVNELSAITANLGHITAGLIEAVNIYASFFATSQGSYPRVEINPSGNNVKVHKDASNYMVIAPGVSGVPTLGFYSSGVLRITYGVIGSTGVIQGNNLYIAPDVDIELYPGGYVKFSNWSTLFSVGSSTTLQQELDDLDARITALETP